jgi:hypothetical protein
LARERSKILLAAIDAAPTCLEADLRRIVRAVETERNTEALQKLWGWNGNDPRVLESVGQEYQLTRERVRQIEARALKRIATYQFDLSFLRRALSLLKNNVPALDAERCNFISHLAFRQQPALDWFP